MIDYVMQKEPLGDSLSAYDIVEQILNEYELPLDVIWRLEKVQDILYEADDDIRELQVNCIKRPIDLTQFKLGDISKKIY
jgi:hypothetical protein